MQSKILPDFIRRTGAVPLVVLALCVVAISFPTASGSAVAGNPTGVWMTQKRTAAVEISPCGDAFCGRVVWLADPTRPDGDIKRDGANPDPALRERPWCGTTIIKDLEPDGPDRWDGGEFYYFKHGRSYDLAMERDGDTLRMRAYVGFPALGRTEVWQRANPQLTFCPQARNDT